MISQYIYSRTTAGYFSKSHTADSTTVTIGKVFLREEQARIVADECAKISTLEDSRPVPRIANGGYRGMLRVRRLSKMLTVVSRSYRLPSNAGQQGESRDFTFTTSYILSDEEKERFLEHPEYMMNLQNFEDFQSVMRRIAESNAIGRGGKIEANPAYSLFNGEFTELNLDLFEKAGFTRKLFVDYIASVIEKVSHHRYSGRENEKVLLILPDRYNQPWEASGGNQFEEAILTATIKVLPRCISGQLNAATCGMDRPDSAAFAGIQLVFMDPGYRIDPAKSEYTVIDLNHQISNAAADLDRRYAEFLWDHLNDPEKRAEFEEKYYSIFERNSSYDNDNSLEKFAYIFKLDDIERTGLSDKFIRNKMLAELLAYVGDAWTENAIDYASKILEEEANHPTYDKNLESALAQYVERPSCPKEIKDKMSAIIIKDILNGSKEKASIDFVVDEVKKGNMPVIQALSDACMEFMKKEEFSNCVTLIQILATQLESRDLDDETRSNIYDTIWYLIMHGSAEDARDIRQIVREEQKKNEKNSQNITLLWESFKKNIRNKTANLTPDVIWFFSQFSMRNEEYFLADEWLPLFKELIEARGKENQKELMMQVRENLVKSIEARATNRKLNALEESEKVIIAFAEGKFNISMERIRSDMEHLSKDKDQTRPILFLVDIYQKKNTDQLKQLFLSRLNNQEKWILIYYMAVHSDGEEDENLNALIEKSYPTRREFLNLYALLPVEDDEQCMKAAELYFYFMEKAVSRSSDPNTLLKWTNLYASEAGIIKGVSGNTNFASYIHAKVKEALEQSSPKMIARLPEENVLFLSNEGFLPLNAISEDGEDFHALDLLAMIYKIGQNDVTETFIPLRTRIRQEEKHLEIYKNALEKKVRTLGMESGSEEIALNIALLLGQMDMRMSGFPVFRTEIVAERVFGNNSSSIMQRIRLSLIYIISRYGYEGSAGMYDCQKIRDQMYNEFEEEVSIHPNVLENREVFQCFRRLDRNAKENIVVMISPYVSEMEDEWLQKYGIARPRRRNVSSREREEREFPVKIVVIAAAAAVVVIIAVIAVLLLLNSGKSSSKPAAVTPTPTIAATATPVPTATPTPEPTAAPTATPIPEPTLIPVETTESGIAVYTISAVYEATAGANIRGDASTSGQQLGTLVTGEQYTVTGVTEIDSEGHFWARIHYSQQDGTVIPGFVRSDMISYVSGDEYPESAIAARKASEAAQDAVAENPEDLEGTAAEEGMEILDTENSVESEGLAYQQ